MNPDQIPRQVVYSALRTNLPFFAVACIILLGGACSLVLAWLRSKDRLLLWVGVLSTLYATRLLAQNELVRDAFNSPGQAYVPWDLCITYLINIPFALFARELLGRGWKGSITIWLWLSAAFAVIAIPTAFVASDAHWVDQTDGLLVVSGTILMVLHVLVDRRAGVRKSTEKPLKLSRNRPMLSVSMGSIASSLNPVTQSLLTEIKPAATGSSTATTGSPSTSSITSENDALFSTDEVNFSQSATLIQELQKLEASNPSEFKQVLSDGATQLTHAANQATDPNTASFLKTLAANFTQTASTGDLSSLRNGLFSSAVTASPEQNLFAYLQTGQSTDSGTEGLLSSILIPASTSDASNQISALLTSLSTTPN